jgi:CRISPR-associated endonuclease Cas2
MLSDMAQLICYDIEDNRRREKLAKELNRLGFVRIQLSVFAGNLRHEACMAVIEKLKLKWDFENAGDKFFLFFIDDNNLENAHCIGSPPDWPMILRKVKYKIF